MRIFIKDNLNNVREKGITQFAYSYTREGGDKISMEGTVKNNLADFVIARTKENGHQCSRMPVFQMPLTDHFIVDIAETAVEAL